MLKIYLAIAIGAILAIVITDIVDMIELKARKKWGE